MTIYSNNDEISKQFAQNFFLGEKNFEKEEKEEKEESKQNLANINALGTPQIPNGLDDSIFVLPIIGHIEGHIIAPPQIYKIRTYYTATCMSRKR